MNNCEVNVFIPGHITGFFEIVDDTNSYLRGSRGAGVALDHGVRTKTCIYDGSGKINIKVNGKKNSLNTITPTTINIIRKLYDVNLDNIDILIEHKHDLPISAGFGTSAGFALGTSMSLAYLLDINISTLTAGSIAHLAELHESSGLGDVISAFSGGCSMRLKAGAPGYGIIDHILTAKPLYVISKTIGSLNTKSIIDNSTYKKRINLSGASLLDMLAKNPSVENFMKLSRRFAENTKLISDELYEILNILDEETIGSSMAMLGNTAFALSYTPEVSIKNCNITKLNSTGFRFY